MKNKQNLKRNENNKGDMKNIARAGLGFIGGFFTLFGVSAIQSRNYIVGSVAVVLGLIVFWYAYKG